MAECRSEDCCIVARDLHRWRGARAVLRGVDVRVRPGELVALTGENGSGKSTLLQVLAGALRPDRGRIERRTSFGYCPQIAALYDHLTPDEHFRLFASAMGLDRVTGRRRGDALLERFGFAADRNTQVAEMSGGTQQKLNLALAILDDPMLVFLDEPYAGFDIETYGRFLEWAEETRARGRAVVVVSHLAYDSGLFDRHLRLREGKLHADRP